MTDLDPRAPVVVGFGELVRRPGEAEPADCEPALLMAEAVRLAAQDAGPGGDALVRRAGLLAAVPPAAWGDGDPGGHVAQRLGLEGVATMRSSLQGGNGPQRLAGAIAQRIQDGALDAAILCGAEAVATLAAARKRDEELPWPQADPSRAPGEVLEGERAPSTEAELAVAMIAPIMAYPLIENAIGAAARRTNAEQLDVAAGLWSRFSEVAAQRACAWTPQAYTPEQLRTVTDDNRLVTHPYRKLLNANIQVDQAAALLLCSVQTAQALGIPRDNWVFAHAAAHATDEWFLSEREHVHRSPAIAACGTAALRHAGCAPDDLSVVDLYSCFPSAVQLAAGELGLPLDDPARPLTATGGLTFFGGPGNNYATHGIGHVVRGLRERGGDARGVATALGWYATKHALGVYGAAPPAHAFAELAPDPAPAARATADPEEGTEAVAETGTVIYERDGSPSYGILFALRDDGARVLGQARDRDVLDAMARDGFLGSRVRFAADRGFTPA